MRGAAFDSLLLSCRMVQECGALRIGEPACLADNSWVGKRDIRQIEAIAKEFNMDPDERRKFGDYIEECKRGGEHGSEPNGDFTYAEFRNKVPVPRGEK